ncbi:alpha/beta fold hydrolase [Streptomyces sp. NPDC004838]
MQVLRRRVVPPLAVIVMATLAPVLAVSPSAAVTSASPGDQYTRQGVTWGDCGPDMPASIRCATVTVPLDYDRPRGETIEVAISRVEAADPAKRRGVLLSNPGGPGLPGLALPLDLAARLPAEVKDRYDLIGLDQRGVGRSAPVECGLTDQERPWPVRFTPATYGRDIAAARTVADKCQAKYGDSLRHFTTRNTARDMDVIRAALGEKKISYVGYSYGTYLGAVYTQMFPKRADRFVLDSAVDPQLVWRGMFQKWGSEADPAFERWARWTAERDATYRLGDTPAEVAETFWDIVAQADRTPIVVGTKTVTGAGIRDYMRAEFFYTTSGWASDLVVVLRDAAAGKPTADLPFFGDPSDNRVSSQWAVMCGDTSSWPQNPETYRQDSLRDADRYRLYGDFPSTIAPCAFWGENAESATRIDNRVPALIIQNEWDPQTPLSSALGMRRALKGSRMVTAAGGEGHIVYAFGGNPCADAAGSTYLTTGRLPAADVTCGVAASRKAADATEAPARLSAPAFR